MLEYDVALTDAAVGADAEAVRRSLRVPLLWPRRATRRDVRVRVWSDGGTLVRPADPAGADWKDRGTEVVPGRDALPTLVVQATEPAEALTLAVEYAPREAPPALVCDRALVQVTVDDDGGQHCRARYVLRKANAAFVDVEFPAPVAECLQAVLLGGHKLAWEPVPAEWNVARLPLRGHGEGKSLVLDLEYKLAAGGADGHRPWQATLHAPRFRTPSSSAGRAGR